jgi:hypothetical protein
MRDAGTWLCTMNEKDKGRGSRRWVHQVDAVVCRRCSNLLGPEVGEYVGEVGEVCEWEGDVWIDGEEVVG